MNLRFDVIVQSRPQEPGEADGLAALLQALEERIVSKLTDKITAVGASADAAIARVATDVTTLHAKVDELQAEVDAGAASQAELDALDALKAKLDALDPTNPVTIPTVPPVTIPTTPTTPTSVPPVTDPAAPPTTPTATDVPPATPPPSPA